MSRVDIRPARSDDYPRLESLIPRLADVPLPHWRSADEVIHTEAAALRAAMDQESGDMAVLVALVDGALAGFIYLVTVSDYFRGDAQSHISMLAVAAEASGRGVSSRLMEAAEEWSRLRGHTMITLNVFHGNEHARTVYDHFGYQPETLRYVKILPLR